MKKIVKFSKNYNKVISIKKSLYRDNTKNLKKKLRVSKFLKSRNIKSFKFYNLTMNKNIKHNKKVHVNQFTFRDSNYNNIITNGTNMILNRKLLVIKL